MSRKQPIEIFMPPNVLKAKVGGGGNGGGIDPATLARAEQAIEAMKGDFAEWVATDVEKLHTARAAFAASADKDTRDTLYRASHDLKGQGATFGYPFVARVADSLCRLLDTVAAEALPAQLIDAHVDAIRVILRDHVKGNASRTATVLAQELEARVTELG